MHRKDFNYSESEKEINKVIKLQDINLSNIVVDSKNNVKKLDETIRMAEQALLSIGLGKEVEKAKNITTNKPIDKNVIVVCSWEEISKEANKEIPYEVSVKDIFTDDELRSNEEYLVKLRQEFNALHRLDAIDYTI